MKIVQYASTWLQALWNKTRDNKPIKIIPWFLWAFLIIIECFYRVCFYVVNNIKHFRRPYHAPWPVISVGNISLGGTGKSVFVRFLMTISTGRSAVLLRGYGRAHEGASQSLIVSDGHTIFTDARQSGDEAYMLAQEFKGPVIVGRSRAVSCKLLEQLIKTSHESVNMVILDDAYQHHSLYKNLEILLLDARYPFENGQEYLGAHSTGEFVTALLSLRDIDKRRSLASAAKEVSARIFSQEALDRITEEGIMTALQKPSNFS